MGHIITVGIELEGAWDQCPENEQVHHDGSVRVTGNFSGEISSRPLPVDQVIPWIQRCYPTKSDKSCGLHIHISLDNKLSYMRLMSKDFYDYFIKEFTVWGNSLDITSTPFWERIRGDNQYCRKEFNPDKQAESKQRNDSRYAHLNFCYTLHKTLECRLLPCFTKVELSVSAVNKFLEIVETYLAQNKREPKYKGAIEDSDNGLKAGEIICV